MTAAVTRDRLADLIARVARRTRHPVKDLVGTRRDAPLARARFAVVWVARQAFTASWPQIGRALGGRSNATVINAYRRAEALRVDQPAFRLLTDAQLAAALEKADA